MGVGVTTLISDANVLIDYFKVGRHRVLKLVAEHVCAIQVPHAIFQEVEQLTEDIAKALGLEIYEETFEQVASASGRGGRLSPQDRLCYEIAAEEGWGVWTSDKRLHRHCSSEDIPVVWGLQMLLVLHERNLIKHDYARTTAEKIFEINEFMAQEVYDGFLVKLDQIKKNGDR